jgi:hypothetical protein
MAGSKEQTITVDRSTTVRGDASPDVRVVLIGDD